MDSNELNIEMMSVKERIIRISNELKIEKTGWNTYGEYAYITPEDLENALRPLLLKYRTFTHLDVRHMENGRNIAVLTISTFENDDDVQIYTMDVPDITLKAANAAQSVAGLRTYCSRYLKMSAFNVAENSDDLDANNNSDTGENKKGTAKEKQSAEKKNPDERIKDELTEFCKKKIAEDVNNRKKIEEELKKYGANGVIKNMTTANKKKALADFKKIFGEVK